MNRRRLRLAARRNCSRRLSGGFSAAAEAGSAVLVRFKIGTAP
jgi:hypothetical protein